jgi:hypothetical protein
MVTACYPPPKYPTRMISTFSCDIAYAVSRGVSE